MTCNSALCAMVSRSGHLWLKAICGADVGVNIISFSRKVFQMLSDMMQHGIESSSSYDEDMPSSFHATGVHQDSVSCREAQA